MLAAFSRGPVVSLGLSFCGIGPTCLTNVKTLVVFIVGQNIIYWSIKYRCREHILTTFRSTPTPCFARIYMETLALHATGFSCLFCLWIFTISLSFNPLTIISRFYCKNSITNDRHQQIPPKSCYDFFFTHHLLVPSQATGLHNVFFSLSDLHLSVLYSFLSFFFLEFPLPLSSEIIWSRKAAERIKREGWGVCVWGGVIFNFGMETCTEICLCTSSCKLYFIC